MRSTSIRHAATCLSALLVLGACTTTSSAQDGSPDVDGPAASDTIARTTADDTSDASATDPPVTDPATTVPTTTVPPTTETTTTVPTTTVPPTTAPPTTAPPTTVAPIPDTVFDASCVARAATNSSLERVARGSADDPTADIDVTSLWVENGFIGTVPAGELVDICAGNGVNDIDGSTPVALNDPAVTRQLVANVERQQQHLNTLFAPFGAGDLAVDGDSGSRTGQRLCGARVALGLDISTADMAPGSDEEATLFSTLSLPTPASNAIESERWVLIDRTCQMMFVGSGNTLTFAFNTSTGSAGFETRLQDRAEAFRFNPAVENGGWHDSSEFPVGVDNPLNGNMYKPLYFDLGQAIHGANSVPSSPQSKGCARLSVNDQNTLVSWLGLADAPDETWRKNEMNVTVSVQGEYVPR